MKEKTIEEEAQELIDQGYFQVSRKYGTVAKMPDGMTPFEALQAADPYFAQTEWERFQDHVRGHYLRVYSKEKKHVDQVVLNVFRRLGGQAA